MATKKKSKTPAAEPLHKPANKLNGKAISARASGTTEARDTARLLLDIGAEVEGIGPVRSRDIQAAFREQKSQREALVFLQGHQVPPALAGRIWRLYEGRTIALIRENPYRLAEEGHGVGFPTADRIARARVTRRR